MGCAACDLPAFSRALVGADLADVFAAVCFGPEADPATMTSIGQKRTLGTTLNRTVERLLTWLCLAFFGAFVLLLTYGIIEPLFSGQIREATKYPRGVKFSLSDEPAKFWNAWGAHAVLAAFFWVLLAASWRATKNIR